MILHQAIIIAIIIVVVVPVNTMVIRSIKVLREAVIIIIQAETSNMLNVPTAIVD